MKNTDKITLTVGQLKKLVKEDINEYGFQNNDMKLSELIAKLKKIEIDHGDLIVAKRSGLDGDYWDTLLKNDYDQLFEIDRKWIIF